jgi:hypothetical protein
MLKGRRSSTPSQKEIEKSEKSNKKQQRAASTSAITNNINNSNSSSHSLMNEMNRGDLSEKIVDISINNNIESSENGNYKHWSEIVCETVLLVLNEGGGLHFDVLGGADEGKFPYIGSLKSSAEDSGVTIQSLSPTSKTYL